MTCKVRCIYVDGEPLPQILVLLPRQPLAKVIIVVGCEVRTFAFKEEAIEFLRRQLKLKEFVIGPCPNS
jgi:hypothetical protein